MYTSRYYKKVEIWCTFFLVCTLILYRFIYLFLKHNYKIYRKIYANLNEILRPKLEVSLNSFISPSGLVHGPLHLIHLLPLLLISRTVSFIFAAHEIRSPERGFHQSVSERGSLILVC